MIDCFSGSSVSLTLFIFSIGRFSMVVREHSLGILEDIYFSTYRFIVSYIFNGLVFIHDGA